MAKPVPIKPVLDDLIKSMGVQKRMDEEKAALLWGEVVGEKISSHARPVRARGGKLFVEVDSSTWMNELLFYKGEIISKLNRRLRRRVIDDIIFVAERGKR